MGGVCGRVGKMNVGKEPKEGEEERRRGQSGKVRKSEVMKWR